MPVEDAAFASGSVLPATVVRGVSGEVRNGRAIRNHPKGCRRGVDARRPRRRRGRRCRGRDPTRRSCASPPRPSTPTRRHHHGIEQRQHSLPTHVRAMRRQAAPPMAAQWGSDVTPRGTRRHPCRSWMRTRCLRTVPLRSYLGVREHAAMAPPCASDGSPASAQRMDVMIPKD